MRLAIIGAGHVGGTLGRAFCKAGHQVVYGVQAPSDPKHEPFRRDGSTVALPVDAAGGADVILLATPWGATQAAITSLGVLTGRIVVDCTNPIRKDFSDLENGPKSGGELVQEWARGAKVVKCFNQTGFENMAQPVYEGRRAVMFAAGDDEAARTTVAQLASAIGFEGIAIGGLALARHLESVAWTWIHAALKAKVFDRTAAFALLKR